MKSSNLRSFLVLVCLLAFITAAVTLAGNRRETRRVVAAADPLTCTPPGTLIVTDPTGDQTGAPAANQQFDIQSVSIAEPCFADGLNKLVFTMKVANLSSIPANGHWKVQFVTPVLPAGVTAFFVEMTRPSMSELTSAR